MGAPLQTINVNSFTFFPYTICNYSLLLHPFNIQLSSDHHHNDKHNEYSIFVFHLPYNMDNKNVLKLFQSFGAMRSHVMRYKNGVYRGYGFVYINTRNNAQIAINTMNVYKIE